MGILERMSKDFLDLLHSTENNISAVDKRVEKVEREIAYADNRFQTVESDIGEHKKQIEAIVSTLETLSEEIVKLRKD